MTKAEIQNITFEIADLTNEIKHHKAEYKFYSKQADLYNKRSNDNLQRWKDAEFKRLALNNKLSVQKTKPSDLPNTIYPHTK